MRRTLDTPAVTADRASAQATDVAVRAQIEVADLTELEALNSASALIDELWGTGRGDSYLAPSHMRAMTHAGNYCAGAFVGGELAGAVVGFLGLDDGGVYLHSHILGVSPAHRGANVGFALKLHQRAWAIARGFDRITWTFDPLVRRNAFFNMHKLGASAGVYLQNHYGVMDDDINGDDESDRILVDWRLDEERVDAAANGGLAEIDVSSIDAQVVLDTDGNTTSQPWGPRIICAVPDDIVEIRRADQQAADRWRRGLRDTLGAAMNDGYQVTGFVRSGWYILERA